MGDLDVKGLRVPKASDVLAERLRHEILEGSLEPGAALPAERKLAEDSGLSRTVVREALRILEIEGLIAVRPGRNGGSVVRRPDADSFTRSLDVFIRGRKVRFDAILEAREQLVPVCAQLAAERRTPADLEALTEATAEVERQLADVSTYLTANVDWHVTVARISHNELLSSFMEALAAAVRTATDIKDFNSLDVRKAATLAHRRVLDAIAAGDGPRARHLMERHVQAYRTMLSGVDVPDEVDLDRDGHGAAES